jgi:HTH-type transcriptional regulator/antitoxin HigA
MTILTLIQFNMNIRPIKTKKEHKVAMKRLDELFDAKPGSAEGDELEVLSILIEHYENKQLLVEYPDPIEAIKFRMEQLGYRSSDLAQLIGYKSRVSEILHKKRNLTVEMIRTLSKKLNIPAEILIQSN